MKILEIAQEIIATYERHGWKLRRVLLRKSASPETKAAFRAALGDTVSEEAEIDALWFARASHAQREAWELRLIAEHPYALFEAFEADETEEQREDVRREMENRMREHTSGN
jgi:hypothetical protein